MRIGNLIQAFEWDSLPRAKFSKNRLRGYTIFWQIYTKNSQFGHFGGLQPPILKVTTVTFRMRMWACDSFQHAKFCKNHTGIYPFGENLYQKLPILATLGAYSPHVNSDNSEVVHEGAGLGVHPLAKFCKNRLRGKCIPQLPIMAILTPVSPHI